MYVIVKIVVSAIVIGIVTEVARRFPAYGGIIATFPLVTLLSVIWLFVQGGKTATLTKFALGAVWGIPATVVMLVIIYIALKHTCHLFAAIGFGLARWGLCLLIQEIVLRYFK